MRPADRAQRPGRQRVAEILRRVAAEERERCAGVEFIPEILEELRASKVPLDRQQINNLAIDAHAMAARDELANLCADARVEEVWIQAAAPLEQSERSGCIADDEFPTGQGVIDIDTCGAKTLLDRQPMLGRQSEKRSLVIQQTLVDECRNHVAQGVRAIEEL